MIKIEKVNKYYNKGKANQIHVIDNTSMTLPDKGIVCLLGPSGCGKTTLLNAIGGLDKVDNCLLRFSFSFNIFCWMTGRSLRTLPSLFA